MQQLESHDPRVGRSDRVCCLWSVLSEVIDWPRAYEIAFIEPPQSFAQDKQSTTHCQLNQRAGGYC